MRTKSKTSSRCSRRAGLTLIEVVAAIAIMGTVLVGIVLAKSRHTRQIAQSQRRATAVRLADELLTAWWTGPSGLPIEQSGRIDADPSLSWRTRLVANAELQEVGARVVRLEIVETNQANPGATASAQPLARVELVVPDPYYQSLVDQLTGAADDDARSSNDRPGRDEADRRAPASRGGESR